MEIKEQAVAKPLHLEGAWNVRDLGGYFNKNGQELKKGRFLRADALGGLTSQDVEALQKYGVVLVVDLRSHQEVEKAPYKWMEQAETIEYVSIPLLDNIQSNDGTVALPENLHELYKSLLEESVPEIRQVLKTFLRKETGCCLFNCSAGKDRTGIIAMLLLGLADVEEDVISADYGVSAGYMEPVFQKQREALEKAGFGKAAFLLGSDPKEMKLTTRYLKERYGSIRAYVETLLSEEETRLLREHLIGKE